MGKTVTISYENGTVTVPMFSRIKIYRKFGGSVRGYIIGEDDEHLILIVPKDVDDFYEGVIVGEIKKFKKSDLNGFNFYPEVIVLETRNPGG